jgi:hypothetical protein
MATTYGRRRAPKSIDFANAVLDALSFSESMLT